MNDVFRNRFSELLEQLNELEKTKETKHSNFSGRYEEVDADTLLNWLVKARSLVSRACGTDSEHYKEFLIAQEYKGYESNYDIFRRVKAVFLAAREDFEGGYLIPFRNLVQAEIADSELDQARELHQSGYVASAAVVAGVVLETTLRMLCDRKEIPHGKLDKMNSDLAKAGVYNSLMQKKITSLAAIRNSAAHGKSQDFTNEDVDSMIIEVERFVRSSTS